MQDGDDNDESEDNKPVPKNRFGRPVPKNKPPKEDELDTHANKGAKIAGKVGKAMGGNAGEVVASGVGKGVGHGVDFAANGLSAIGIGNSKMAEAGRNQGGRKGRKRG